MKDMITKTRNDESTKTSFIQLYFEISYLRAFVMT